MPKSPKNSKSKSKEKSSPDKSGAKSKANAAEASGLDALVVQYEEKLASENPTSSDKDLASSKDKKVVKKPKTKNAKSDDEMISNEKQLKSSGGSKNKKIPKKSSPTQSKLKIKASPAKTIGKKRTRNELEDDDETEEIEPKIKKRAKKSPAENSLDENYTKVVNEELLNNKEILAYIDSQIQMQCANHAKTNSQLGDKIKAFIKEVADEHKLISEGQNLLNTKILKFLASIRKELLSTQKEKEDGDDQRKSHSSEQMVTDLLNNVEVKEDEDKDDSEYSLSEASKQKEKADSLKWKEQKFKCPLSRKKQKELIKECHSTDGLVKKRFTQYSEEQLLFIICPETLAEQQGMGPAARQKHLLSKPAFKDFAGKLSITTITHIYKYFQLI